MRNKFRAKYLFDHDLEEKKALKYLMNLINSSVLHSRPFELFNFASDVLGFDKTVGLLINFSPDLKKKDDVYDENTIRNNLNHHVSPNAMAFMIRKSIPALIEKRLRELSSHKLCEVEERFSILKDTFKLTDEELEVLMFYYLFQGGIMKEYFYNRNIFDLSEFSKFRSFAHNLFGLRRSSISRVFSEGRLLKSYLIEKPSIIIDMTDWCSEYLSGLGGRELSHEFFSRNNDITLALSDFDIPQDELAVIETLIRSNTGQNILFYGKPGTGKTSLAKCLAKTYDNALITAKIPERDDHKDRISAICACINAAEKDASIILIDEADDILNTESSFFFNSKTNKSWINNLMENHQQKIIWITNRFESIHPSTMRRFSFSMEFKNCDEKKRKQILIHELGREGLSDFFSDDEVSELCKTYSVNAAGIISAIHTLNIDKTIDKESAMRKINAVLKNHEKVTCRNPVSINKQRDFSGYSLAGLNCSEDPEKIINILKKYLEVKEKEPSKCNQPMSLLFYGRPGTGKSEFVYYLGHILDKEVVLRRCSDIHSMWVGETEKNIAKAFREARENNSILFFDEADSFLFPRKDALRSWEKNFTNEILTQLENYTGIVIFATNDIEGLDHASLRRFRFKMEFRALTPEGILHFYHILLKPLVREGNPLSPGEERFLKSIQNLTPGDFAVVRDKHLFDDPSSILHRQFIQDLGEETKYKQKEKMVKGFQAA